MVETVRTVDELINSLFAMGQVPGSITEQDVRDMIVSISLETTDLSSLPRSPAGLPLGRLWVDDSTKALKVVTVYQPYNLVEFVRVAGSGRLFAEGLLPGAQVWPAEATLGGQGVWTAEGTYRGGLSGSAKTLGAGLLSATPVRRMLAGQQIRPGAGSISAAPRQRMRASRTLGGVGGIAGNGTVVQGQVSQQHWGDHGSAMALSNGNLTVTMDPGDPSYYHSCVGTIFKTSGKWYWEIQISDQYWVTSIGLGNPSISLEGGDATWGSFLGLDGNSIGVITRDDDTTHGMDVYGWSNTYYDLPPIGRGSRMSIALDCTNWKWWIRMDGGRWNGDEAGTQNPATNAGGMPVPEDLRVGGVAPAVSMTGNDYDWVTGCFASNTWGYIAPSGFSAM